MSIENRPIHSERKYNGGYQEVEGGGGGGENYCLMSTLLLFVVKNKVLHGWMVVMVSQQCECTRCQ